MSVMASFLLPPAPRRRAPASRAVHPWRANVTSRTTAHATIAAPRSAPARDRVRRAPCGKNKGPGPLGVSVRPDRGAIPRPLVVNRRRHRLHHAVEVEAPRLLAWRELAEALEPVGHVGAGGRDEEHALEVPALEAHRVLLLGTLERIHAEVGDQRRAQHGERLLPHLEPDPFLLEERDLPVAIAERRDAAVVGPVEELAAGPRRLAAERRSEV